MGKSTRLFPIRRLGCLVALVMLGLALVPVECSVAMGPHSVFVDRVRLAELQGAATDHGNNGSAAPVVAGAGNGNHAAGGHAVPAPHSAVPEIGSDAAGANPPMTADVDAAVGAVLLAALLLPAGRPAARFVLSPSLPVPAAERGPDRPPP